MVLEQLTTLREQFKHKKVTFIVILMMIKQIIIIIITVTITTIIIIIGDCSSTQSLGSFIFDNENKGEYD